MAKSAKHSPVRAAAAAAGKRRATRKSAGSASSSSKSGSKGTLAKAAAAVSDAGSKAVDAVVDIAHKGEELVAKVLGGKSSTGSGKGGGKGAKKKK